MRGLTQAEHEELSALDAGGERTFYTLDALIAARRAEEWDAAPDGSYRVRSTELGRLALTLWPLIAR